MQAVLGNLSDTGDYITRAVPCGDDAKVTIMYEAFMPGDAASEVFIQNENGSWLSVDFKDAKPIGDGWEEKRYVFNEISTPETRVKLILKGSPLNRPKVRNLRVVIT